MNDEDAMNKFREVAWHDTLTTDEQVNVERLSSMPPAMAVAYVYVEVKREMNDLREEHRQAIEEARQAGRTATLVRNVATGAGGGVLVALAYLGHAMGLDKMLR